MIRFIFAIVFMIQAVLARVSTAELSDPPTKPVITPEFHWSELENNFVAALPQNNFHIDSMDHSWTTDACKSFARVARLGVSDYRLFNVTYDDCPEPWVFCHHTGAMASLVDVVETFGLIPVAMRQYVRSLIVSPYLNDSILASSSDDVVNIRWNANVWLFAHELGHSLDFHHHFVHSTGSPDTGKNVSQNCVSHQTRSQDKQEQGKQPVQYSKSEEWQRSEKQDDAVVTHYAQHTWTEHFAETAVAAIYNVLVPNGLAKLHPNATQVHHQVELWEKIFGHTATPGGRCTGRHAHSRIVWKEDRKVGKARLPAHGFISAVAMLPDTPEGPRKRPFVTRARKV